MPDAELTQLLQDISDEHTVGDSVIVLLDDVKRRLDEAIAAGGNVEAIKARLREMSSLITTQKQEFADAVVRNTPAAPTP